MVTEHMRCEPSAAIDARKESPSDVGSLATMRVCAASCLMSSEVLRPIFAGNHGLTTASRVAVDRHAKIRKMSASEAGEGAVVGTSRLGCSGQNAPSKRIEVAHCSHTSFPAS